MEKQWVHNECAYDCPIHLQIQILGHFIPLKKCIKKKNSITAFSEEIVLISPTFCNCISKKYNKLDHTTVNKSVASSILKVFEFCWP